MTLFEIQDLEKIFDDGALSSCVVARVPMGTGFVLVFNNKNGKQQMGICSQRDKRNPRIFKNIETAIKNAEMIGFKTITVQLD